MLLKDYHLTTVLSECNPSAHTVNAIADLSQDIGEVMPYLNRVLKNAVYDHEAKILNFKMEGHLITLYPMKINLTKLKDAQEARQLLEQIKNLINETYGDRKNIALCYERRDKPKAIDIFKLLPGKNCRECGEPSCLAFSVKLANEEASIGDCPLIFQEEFREKREKLLDLLGESVPGHPLEEEMVFVG